MTILITRPLAAAKRTEQAFQLAGFETWIAPVLTIIPLQVTINPAAYDAIITTSANGVESVATLTQDRDTPIFCAGKTSATVVYELGFTSAFYPSEPGGKELITLIKQSSFKRFAYIRGEVIKIDIAHALQDVPDVHVDTYITYKTVPTSAWTDETLDLFHTNKISAITFYSEHSAQIILNLLNTHNFLDYTPFITALCLSPAIAEAIQSIVWKNIEIASTSDELVANLLKTRKITMEPTNDNEYKPDAFSH
jgi:uroporphyrinogen-III synthase